MIADVTISIEVPSTHILGVFGNEIHLLTDGYKNDEPPTVDIPEDAGFECILMVPIDVYLKQWKAWIKGKKRYCEKWDEYCGVMGYVTAINPHSLGTKPFSRWNGETEKFDKIEMPLYSADEFTSPPDFEHG